MRAIAVLTVIAALIGGRASAQNTVRQLGVFGTIIEAQSGRPLAYAQVSLEPAPAGVLPGSGAAVQRTRMTTSNADGTYYFDAVAQGDYRLHVQRIGYRSRSVEVRVRPESSARVSIGLEIQPVALESVRVAAGAAAGVSDAYARHATALDDLAEQGARRIATERLRQRLYLSSDVRAVTHADVLEGVSLGESDLFRSLHRFPGVSTADEWSAELWTRGAPWDQTRVYFDGLPLFNAVHALGVFSGVNADAIGAAFLHPGAQPVAVSGGGAGALDIRSRTGTGNGEVNGVGELSLASARASLDRRSSDADHAWMFAARRTYVDLATRLLANVVGDEVRLPYSFFDIAGRTDVQLAPGTTLELSSLFANDNAHGEIPDVLENTRAKWGGGVVRATVATTQWGMQARHTVGYSHYGSQIRDVTGDDPEDVFTVGKQRTAQNDLDYYVARGELQPLGASAWTGGYEFARYAVRYDGDNPATNPARITGDTLRYEPGLNVASAWLQRRLELGSIVTGDIGLRLESGSNVSNRTRVALAPRASMRLQVGSQTTASLSVGRTWQYTQALNPAGIAPVKGFSSDFLWLLADDSTPALRSDVAGAGIEQWLGDSWIVALNAYLRRASGLTIADPAPGQLLQRPLFVSAQNRARGVEVSVRRLSGRVTGSAAYSYGRSTLRHNQLEFAAPGDQRHILDTTMSVHISDHWLIGAAYTAATGTPYTRRWNGLLACDTAGQCQWQEIPRQEEPGARRRANFQSLDLNVEWLRRFEHWRMTAFLQVRNLLNHANQGRYVEAESICQLRCGTDAQGNEFGFVTHDEFLPGLPTIPLIGLRISF